jgi:hypothetical protein
MRQVRSAFLLAAALALGFSPARAARPLTPPAPEFPPSDAWINAKPLTLQLMRGRRATLVFFFSSANLNSLRVLPVIKAWHERYALKGLMVIGVHTPEYSFQRDPTAVRVAVKRLGLEFPVVVDNDRKIWNAYANEGWPALYLIDHKGRIIFDRLGEGAYAEVEREIREAVADVPGYSEPSEPPLVAEDPPAKECGKATREVSLAAGKTHIINMDEGEIAPFLLLGESRSGETSTRGKWEREPERMIMAQKNPEQTAFLRLIYQGAQVFALLGAPEGTKYFVRQDDLWLHPGNASRLIRYGKEGESYISVSGTGLYELVRNPDDSMHELVLIPMIPGSAVFGFSFSDQCGRLKLP